MQASEIALYGLGGTAFFGILSFLFQKIASKTIDKPKVDPEKQEEAVEHIKTLQKEQEVVDAQLAKARNSSKEAQQKVKTIIQKAAKEVQETLNEDSVKQINKHLDEGWDEL